MKSRIRSPAQAAPWHSLNFLPDPHGHGALRGVFSKASLTTVVGLLVGAGAGAADGGRSPSATAIARARSKPVSCRRVVARRGLHVEHLRRVERRRFLLHDLDVHHVAHEVLGDRLHHRPEHLVALALPLGERVLLAHRPEVDALLEVVHLLEVLAPALVDDAQHHLTLDLAHHLGTELGLALLVVGGGLGHHQVVEIVGVAGVEQVVGGQLRRPEQRQLLGEAVDVPLVGGDRLAVRLDQRVDGLGQVLGGGGLEVFALEDLVAAHVDHAPLLVHDLVVLEDVLADLGVLLLDRGLRPLDRLRDHLRLDRLVVVEATHRPLQRTGGEQTHQLVVEAEVEPALAGVALTAGTTTQLVVDAARVVTLGADHIQTADLDHLLALGGGTRP